jgi:hypothetical protein
MDCEGAADSGGDRVCWSRRTDFTAASSVSEALPCEPSKQNAKVLHGASPQRITVVLGALVRPRRSTAHQGTKPIGRQPYTVHSVHPMP